MDSNVSILAILAIAAFVIVILGIVFWPDSKPNSHNQSRSVRHSRSLSSISRELGKQRSCEEMLNDFMSKAVSGTQSSHDQALEDLYVLVETDPELRRILDDHGANRDTLEAIMSALLRSGAGQWVGRHWVPASTLAHPATLEYVLTELDPTSVDSAMKAANKLIQYFGSGQSGRVV